MRTHGGPARRRALIAGILLLACGVAASIVVVSVPPLYAIAGVLVAMAVVYVAWSPPRRRPWVLLLFITFPITIQIAERDAFSTGTLLIVLLFVVHWVMSRRPAFVRDPALILMLVALVVIAGIGVITGMERIYWASGLRRWVDLVASVGAFLLVIGWARASKETGRAYVEAVITALLCVAALHVLISLALRQWPGLESHLSIFRLRGQESLGLVTEEGVYVRATTVFTQDEQFGEFLLLLFPFALYRLFTGRVSVFLPLTLILVIGAVYTGTRSCLLLMLLQLLVFFAILTFRRARGRYFTIAVVTLLLLGASMSLITSILDTTLSRFTESVGLWEQGASVLTVLNRDRVWTYASQVVGSTLSWFGHGPVQAYVVGLGVRNFHSLYMTWVYQFGIVGTIVWVGFFVHLIRRMWLAFRSLRLKMDVGALLMAACFLSLLAFLVNEVKFEFNRDDSYQQIVWMVFALCYVASGAVRRARTRTR